MEFVVCTSDYDLNSGGVVCLHALSDCLAELGHSVFIAPLINDEGWSPFSPWESTKRVVGNYRAGMRRPRPSEQGRAQAVNMFEARRLALGGAFFVYPEIVFGNPYRARHVLRWLLHYPMHHRGVIHWGSSDWVVRFNDAIPRVVLPGINFIERFLKVVKYPVGTYAARRGTARSGSAYLVRKGVNKPAVHPPDAICIDGLNHEQVAEILGRVEKFYSYDVYTAYSYLAVVAGCLSIVVPDADRPLEAWYPAVEDRWGLAYGEDQADWARATAHLVPSRLQAEESKSLEDIKAVLAHLPTQDAPRA